MRELTPGERTSRAATRSPTKQRRCGRPASHVPRGCPSFSLKPNRTLPPAEVVERIPTDAHGTDPAGNLVGVLLFVDDGYLSEVEVFNYEGSDFAGLPDPSALKLSEWSEATDAGVRHLLNP